MTYNYSKELSYFPTTYDFALGYEITPLAEILNAARDLPLVVVGSGGSLSAAHFVANLHQRFTGQIGKAVTPLELLDNFPHFGKLALCCLSASGRNKDILTAFQFAATKEPSLLFSLSASLNSPLASLAKSYSGEDFSFSLPTGKDGFLATNSLLSFALLLSRAYTELTKCNIQLPQSFDALIGPEINDPSRELERQFAELWPLETIKVLYAPSLHPAAVDLESKFIEAALGNIQCTDFRNFGHGQHNWLAKRAASTGIIALSSISTRSLSEKTLNLIPSNIPTVNLHFPQEAPLNCIAALCIAMRAVSFAASHKGIDPARPRIPLFGRRLFNLSPNPLPSSKQSGPGHSAIERKIRASGASQSAETRRLWVRHLKRFVDELEHTHFASVVFDYDGTLCNIDQRFDPLNESVTRHLVRLASGGAYIGIASGRGRSLRELFRKAIPESLWLNFAIGLYNGSATSMLNEDFNLDQQASTELLLLSNALSTSPLIIDSADLDLRPLQLSIVPRRSISIARLWQLVSHFVALTPWSHLRVMRSSHSVDVLAAGVSKTAVVELLRLHRLGPTLCIADQGIWPGNDSHLLAKHPSLSVNEVSPDPLTCWNVAPPGLRNLQASLYYLERISTTPEGFLVFSHSRRT